MIKKITALSMLTAFALIISIIEDRIPLPVSLPGVKLGLANIFIFCAIILFGFNDALLVVLVRSTINAIFGSTPITLLYSLPAGISSAVVMFFLYKYHSKHISIVSISVCSAITHILTQLVIVYFVSAKDVLIFSLAPFLLLSAIATGIFVGICTKAISNRLKKIISL